MEAAMPSMASARLSHSGSAGVFKRKGAVLSAPYGSGFALLLCGRELLQLGVELVEDRLGVDALGARLLDPLVDDRPRALLGFRHHRGIGLDDRPAGLLQGLHADLVGAVPVLAV